MYRWFRENKFIAISIIIVLVVAIIFVGSLILHRNNNSGNILNDVNSKISSVLSKATESVNNTFGEYFRFKDLQGQIDILEKENLELKKELELARITREEEENLEELSNVLNYEYIKLDYELISGKVTYYDGANFTSVFTINIGEDEGVELGDPVVNGDGLVGKIIQVGSGWSKVLSLCDDQSRVSFRLVRDHKELGVVNGTSGGEVEGFMMDGESEVQEGDTLITSGLGNYPEGLEIGNVKTVKYNSDTMLREITVESIVDFDKISAVSVVKVTQSDDAETEDEEKEEKR